MPREPCALECQWLLETDLTTWMNLALDFSPPNIHRGPTDSRPPYDSGQALV